MSSVIDTLFSKRDLESLQSEAPTPLYFQMYTLLKNRILDGTIPHDTQMPTEQQLAEAFNVSRITAKRAMDELAVEELVVRRRGKGTHVTHHYEPAPVSAPLVGMLETLTIMGRQTKVQVLDVDRLVPPGDIRVDLGLEAGEKADRVVRVRSNEEGEPFAYYISWTTGISQGFTKENLESKVRLDIIKENGIETAKIEQTLGATVALEFFADLIDVPLGDPVLTLLRRTYTADDKVADILYGYYNPKRFQYRMEMGVDSYKL